MRQKPMLANQRYELVSILGSGGMASVFRAYDTRLKVERAIKVLSPQLTSRKLIRSRFESEASMMASLHHKNIVTVHDIGTEGKVVYMVMEMLPGGSLMDRVDHHGPLHPQQAIQAAIAMATGLGYAHEKNVIHRDVKPHNVLISEKGILKMADFGIARIDDGSTSVTKTGAVMGTLAYMAPEQRLSARRADAKSDLYAVVASFFAVLTQYNPLELYSEDVQDDLLKDLDPKIQEFIRRGCHFNPDLRFQNSVELVAALEQLSTELEPLDEASKPIFIPHTSQKEREELSVEEINSLNTLWDTINGDSVSKVGLPSIGTENHTLDIELFTEEQPLSTAEIESAATQAIPPARPEPTQVVATLPEAKTNSYEMLTLLLFGILMVIAGGWLVNSLNSEKEHSTGQFTPPPAKNETQEPAQKTEISPATETKPQVEEIKAEKSAEPSKETKSEETTESTPTQVNSPTSTPKKNSASSTTTAPPKTPKGKGDVVFTSQPYPKSISIDGNSHSGAFRNKLDAGRHTIIFTAHDGRTHRKTLYVKANVNTLYCWNFDMGAECNKR